MDIAIVSPSPKPFAMGGIEKLMLGLYQHIDELTDHRVELFKIPTEENGFWELIWSYKTFYELDLNHFDKVITCKYPAWMVQHRNHTVYMAHHLRGLFDTYHFMNLPTDIQHTSYSLINEIVAYTQDPHNMLIDLTFFFEQINLLYVNRGNYSKELFVFPGPFIRTLIHFLDRWALHPSRIVRYTSISRTVKNRSDYFPDKVNIEVIYPPTSLRGLQGGSYEYFLVVGRLDGAKRVELVINAMLQIDNPNINLLIAGTGPDESRLKQVASKDNRIKFIGYINNEQLKRLYADALAVVYVPYDEDYGLVTIEAMHCGKPVITCRDSGGTTEFVRDGETGLIANNDPNSLAEKMGMLANNRMMAMELGANAREHVKLINWENCINSLLKDAGPIKGSIETINQRKKITVLSTYPVLPRKHGGQLRIFNIYKNLDHEFDVTIVSLNNESKYYERIVGNLTEISIPMSSIHLEREWEIEREVGIPITDIAMEQLIQYTPDYLKVADQHLSESDILISAQPYLYQLLEKYAGGKILIYDSQNVEYELKQSMLPDNSKSKKLLADLFKLEQRACSTSDIILACSNEDRLKLIELYNAPSDKFLLVPNGVDTSINPFIDYESRQFNKRELGLDKENVIVFIGSWHKPNLEAVEEIFLIAPQLPDCKFIIMGGQSLAFKDRTPPQNVVFAGIVDEQLKQLVYSIADIAINPMITGSGTNLKIAEYMSNGIPVISTEVGARGYNVRHNETVILSKRSEFSKEIRKLIASPALKEAISTNAHSLVKEHFDWKNISTVILDWLKSK